MVYFNDFSLEIISSDGNLDKFTREGAKYVGIINGSEYKLKLGNHRNTICDVKVELEGKVVGKWRIPANDSIVIERPADKAKKFTFVSEMSMEAIDAGVIAKESTNGLIKVTFYPKKKVKYEKISEIDILETPEPRSFLASGPLQPLEHSDFSTNMRKSLDQSKTISPKISYKRYEAGATVLGDSSSQRFSEIKSLTPDQINQDEITTIYVRLVVKKEVQPIQKKTPYPHRI